MSTSDLVSDEGLCAAIRSLETPQSWGKDGPTWIQNLAGTIDWVRRSGEAERATESFQQRLWNDNHVAAIGQGQISVDEALSDEGFRRWFAAKSIESIPTSPEARLPFLTDVYESLKARLEQLLTRGKTPHLKIFRVMAALYPEAMTTVASSGSLHKLTRAMGMVQALKPVERHVWVRTRIDALLGEPRPEPEHLAIRMCIPWILYKHFVQITGELTETETKPGEQTQLLPLPAARRRRGMTAIRGLFPGVLSTLEFVREGVTRTELIDFLRAGSPDAKESSLGISINVLQSELAVIKAEGDRCVLTERGEDVLESQDPSHLADWLLTRVLGVDKAIQELRDRGPLAPNDLVAAVQTMNPGWTSRFAPQAIVAWLRSMDVVETTPQLKHALTQTGQQWASRIIWTPEALPADPEIAPPQPSPVSGPEEELDVDLPDLPSIVEIIQRAGHFPDGLVARLHAGIWSNPNRHFGILTGLSGSGKTLLARAYGAAISRGNASRQLFTLAVQPGWYDPGALLGYINPLRDNSYVRTHFLEFLTAAASDPTRPYVAVLDEMNLSHPEQYMAPLLSAMETGGEILLHTEGDIFDGVPKSIPYPRNLVLIGTVNMDETTHGISDKVLDRAFVLEFWEIDLDAYPHWGTRSIEDALETRTRAILSALMAALSPARLHFGWRVVDDILNFLALATNSSKALSIEAALDGVVYAKVLPKLRGEDSPRFRDALAGCEAALRAHGLEQSRLKVAELRRDLETTGSARFWR
jgi:5-methylcytosine-specific restriction protein B